MSGTLELCGVSRTFGSVVALQQTDLTIEEGSFCALLGPSGCGKTTTLRIIAGFETPDTGTVRIAGKDVLSLPPNRRNLGMMFQDYALFPHMTIGDNVAFGLRMAGIGRADRERKVREALEMVHLPRVEARFPHELSGGQRQRVALARSLVTNPQVLLLDEPLSALDKNLRENMQFELKRLQRELGITTVMVTHDQEEALTLSDNIAVMSAGRIRQFGSPTTVYDKPNSRFVSEFLGAANIFSGTRESEDCLRIGGGSDAISVTLPDDAPSAKMLSLGVRPEKMRMSAERPALDTAIQCRIEAEVFRGSSRAFELSHPAFSSSVLAYSLASDLSGSGLPAKGEMVWIGWDKHNSFVFEIED
ncbi:ABC transporter ATP-binding protein [Martelella sp. HB161492]|uniref:ABC transporter ATP-binding protein n=1 Tax=Martelella sp. HB161492 TaxID=2720726 RepID=UPI001591FA9D|nr:ABC transporter ATP-binding protein [Martelella sp. HB161492]